MIYHITLKQLWIVLALSLSSVLAIVSYWRKSWPNSSQVTQLAVGTVGIYGGVDLIHFAWSSGDAVTTDRAVWLTMVGVGLIFFAVQALWVHVLSPRRKAPLE